MNKTNMATLIALTFAAVTPVATFAQTAPAAPAAAPVEPARLDAARKLMDEIMPPAMREQMMTSIMQSMMGTMVQSMRQNPDFTRAITAEPKAAAAFDSFIKRQQTLATQDLVASLPGMIDAMAHAYARRFTIDQLHDLSVFFATPTGQTYVVAAPTVMSDPDVAQWMTGMMHRSQERLPTELAKLMADLKAALPAKSSHGG